MQDRATLTLKKLKLKVTTLRLALLQFIFDASLPFSVQVLMDYLTENNVAFDKVTIYRNLEILMQKGVIKKIDLQDGKYYYEKDDNCSHLICKNCGAVSHIHLPKDQNKEAVAKVARKTGFVVEQEVRDFFGSCKDCHNV